MVLKCGAALDVHSCSLGAPSLIKEMKAAGVKAAAGPKPDTPACNAMRAIGQWNSAWDPFYEVSPAWTDQFFAFGAGLYKSGLFTPRFLELISIAFDASVALHFNRFFRAFGAGWAARHNASRCTPVV